MAVQVAIPGMRRINHRVADMVYAADVGVDGITTVDIPAMPAASSNAILAAQSVNAAGVAVPIASFNPAMMGRYGRNFTGTLSAVGSCTVIVTGYDYLGQPMREQLGVANSLTLGQKMFADISSISFSAVAGLTLNLGFGNILGVPYKVLNTQMLGETVNDLVPTAGALQTGVTVQTLTSGDPRGRYTPNQSPGGTTFYRFTCFVDRNNLHGSAHV